MPARLNLRRPSTAVNAVLAVALVAGGVTAYETLHTSDSNRSAGTATVTVPVQRGTVTKTVSADGSVASARTASASFVTAGTVTAIDVRVGQAVTKGQVLAKVDPAAAQRDLDAANADLDAAEESLARAEAAGSDTSTAQSAVEQAKLEVGSAQAAIDGCTLTAPMAGTVTAINGTLGSSSSSGGSSSTSTSGGSAGGGSSSGGSSGSTSASSGFIEIEDLSKLQVTAEFAESDATALKTGQAATITWNALGNVTEPGHVVSIDPAATTSDSVVEYGVTLSIGKLPAGIKSGQTVSVSVTTGTATGALFVNSAAITSVGTSHTVVVVSSGRQQAVAVEIGLVGDTTTQITSGVQVGQRLVVNTASSTSGSGTGGFTGGGGLGGAGAGAGGLGGAAGLGGAPGGGNR